MKFWKRALSVLLVLTMVLTFACVPALAANPYHIQKYVAFGDSIATGMNEEKGPLKEPAGEVDENGEAVLVEIIGSNGIGYTDDVARALGLTYGEDYISYAHTGLRSGDIRYMFDAVFAAGDGATEAAAAYGYGELREQIAQDVREADLITLNVGENDVFTMPLVAAVVLQLAEEAQNASEQQQVAEAAEVVEQAENVEDALSGVTNALKSVDLLRKFIQKLIPLCILGYQAFKQNFPAALAAIRALNPKAQIVVLGMFNPVVALLKNDLLSAADGLDAIVTPMNLFIAATCAKYNCTFVGMTDIQIDSTFHPTTPMYQKMADRIVSTLTTQTSFTDVSALSNEFKTAVNWAVQTDVTTGTSATTFSPNETCTRAQIVTFLWRMAGEPEPTQTADFGDLTQDWYAKSVAWAAENGITTGTGSGTFSPDATCTRAQIVTFLYRYDQKFNPDAKSGAATTNFRDVSLGAYYGAPVAWAVRNGITKGISAVLFAPLQPCTRAQAVTFLYRYSML